MKTNFFLVEYAKAQVGRPYWFGTFGQISDAKVWENKAKQYPKYYSETRKKKAIPAQCGKKVHDCAGLIKGALWSETADTPAKYKAAEDWSADMMYNKATEKGPIKSIPEIPGILVWRKGHIGVYIGGGKVVEAKGFDYGVVESKLAGSTFTHWLKHPLFEYKTAETPTPTTTKPVEKPVTTTTKTPSTLTHFVNTQRDNLNVRKTPNGQILTSIPKDFKVKVVEESGDWARITAPAGWVFKSYLKPL